MNGYICFYNSKKFECKAANLWDAKVSTLKYFNPPKSKQHMVSVTLAEKDEQPIIHIADQ